MIFVIDYLSLRRLGQRVDLQLNTVHIQEHLVQVLDLISKQTFNFKSRNRQDVGLQFLTLAYRTKRDRPPLEMD
jgi:hypothetical protein